MHAPAKRWWLWLVLSAAIIVIDQWSKAAILAMLKPGEELPINVFASLVLAFNTGAAFSFLSSADGWQRYLFSGLALIAGAVIVWLLRRGGNRLFCLALSLILGGALGNLWDRITMGQVVDFLVIHNFLPFRNQPFLSWLDPFPAFNVADSAISIGAALLIFDSMRRHEGSDAAHDATA